MVPALRQPPTQSPGESADDQHPAVSEECLVLRNYDGERSHQVQVQFLDAEDEIAYRGTHTVAPLGVVAISERIDRAVYRVEVSVDGGTSATRECLVGSGPRETALIEIGNGLVSISEGAV